MNSISWPPQLFALSVVVGLIKLPGISRWVISGAAGLTYCLILGSYNGYRVFPSIGLWTLIATINLLYFLSATSWLFYWVYASWCYPAIFLVSLYQFGIVSRALRRQLRHLLKTSHFLDDKAAYFDLPALEIDTEVDGLMVVRGITVHISSLRIVAHGVEVGIKISDEMELAIQVEEVVISLFRGVEIGDVYANVKGGAYEMSFGEPLGRTKTAEGDAMMCTDTPILKAAASRPLNLRTITAELTNGHAPQQVSDPAEAAKAITELSLDDEQAAKKYGEIIRSIRRSSAIDESGHAVDKLMDEGLEAGGQGIISNSESSRFITVEHSIVKDRRAAICSQLHGKPTIAHPPKYSIKVTTLQSMGPPALKKMLHRMPLLYRLLLGPVAYFHPVHIGSITAAASGKWIKAMLNNKVFRRQTDDDTELTKLESRISTWLSDANFVLEMVDMKGVAQVPIVRGFTIDCDLGIEDTMAYRTETQRTSLKQVVRLGGADATIQTPSFLLPHHEHWLPERPSKSDVQEQESAIDEADGVPKAVQAGQELEQMRKDETNVKISAHVRLPAVFDQELLDFVAAIVKATKVVEAERELNEPDVDSDADVDNTDAESIASVASADTTDTNGKIKKPSTFRTFGHNLSQDFKGFGSKKADKEKDTDTDSIASAEDIAPDDISITSVNSFSAPQRAGTFKILSKDLGRDFRGFNTSVKSANTQLRDKMKRSTINAMANDRWIAKMVGKITRKLETARGEFGYSGDLPVPLGPYRERGEEASKLLP